MGKICIFFELWNVHVFKPIRFITYIVYFAKNHFPQAKSKKWKKQQRLFIGSIFLLVVLTFLIGLFIGLSDSSGTENEIDNKTLTFYSEPIGNQ